MSKKILIDFEKIKDPFSGLGQFCAHLKNHYDKAPFNLNYWIPKNKKDKLAKHISFMLPTCDVFHAIHQDSPYLPWDKKTRYILTIHDLNALYENHEHQFQIKYKKKLQEKINRADVVTFISEFTRNEVYKNLNLKDKRCEVIYNGISLPEKSKPPGKIPSRPFFFAIGTVLPKKNFQVLIAMMEQLPEFELIIAGTTFHQYAKEIHLEIVERNLTDRVHLVGTISDEEKRWYYENSKAFMFPSLLEGFGLPVAEAMSLGVPLFLSRKTSLPEIGGDVAFYFDSFDPIEMASTVKNGLQRFTPELKNKLIERSKLFDWKKASEHYLKIYNNL